jgi:hypothetical protein
MARNFLISRCLKSFKLTRKRRCFLIFFIFILILVKFYFLDKLDEKYESIQIDISKYKSIYDDTQVDTSSYLQDYELLVKKWQPVKEKLDRETSSIKIKISSGRVLFDKKHDYLILEQTKIGEREKFCHQNAQTLFLNECPFKNCKFTCDKSKLNQADALLFHESDLKLDLIENPSYYEDLSVKAKKNRLEQLWILYNDEVK